MSLNNDESLIFGGGGGGGWDHYLNSSYVATFWCTALNLASFSLEYLLSASNAEANSFSSLSILMCAWF